MAPKTCEKPAKRRGRKPVETGVYETPKQPLHGLFHRAVVSSSGMVTVGMSHRQFLDATREGGC